MDAFSDFDVEPSVLHYYDLTSLSDSSSAPFVDPWFAVAHPELSRQPLRNGAKRRSVAPQNKENDSAADSRQEDRALSAAKSGKGVAKASESSPRAATSSTAAEERMAKLAVFKAQKAAEKASKSSCPSSKRSRVDSKATSDSK